MSFAVALIVVSCLLYYLNPSIFILILLIGTVIWGYFTFQFFRYPKRAAPKEVDGYIYSPADGQVVVVEEVDKPKHFDDKRIQVSIFMSPVNVHVNWTPCPGKVLHSEIIPGKFLFAANPKSSDLNERSEILIDAYGRTKILVKQIAGIMAKRIINTAVKDQALKYHDEIGFIKFGSRVDLILPENAEILVKIGDKVTGSQTLIAKV